MELANVLPEEMVFPYDFGFVPSTLGADGDPLDVLILMDVSVVPGCVITARLVGRSRKTGRVTTALLQLPHMLNCTTQ